MESGESPSYVYSYPTKLAYVPLENSGTGLKEDQVIKHAWGGYKGPLNIYMHIPYCQMKCSFCNLFTTMNFNDAKLDRYVEALKTEVRSIFQEIQETNGIELRRFTLGVVLQQLFNLDC